MLKVYPLEVSCSWEVTRTNESVCRAGWKLSVALKECYEFGVKQVVSKDHFLLCSFFFFFFSRGGGWITYRTTKGRKGLSTKREKTLVSTKVSWFQSDDGAAFVFFIYHMKNLMARNRGVCVNEGQNVSFKQMSHDLEG